MTQEVDLPDLYPVWKL